MAKKRNRNGRKQGGGSFYKLSYPKACKLLCYCLIGSRQSIPNPRSSLRELGQAVLDLAVLTSARNVLGNELPGIDPDPEFPDGYWQVMIPMWKSAGLTAKQIAARVVMIRQSTREDGALLGEIETDDTPMANDLLDDLTGSVDSGDVSDLWNDLFR